MQSFISKCLSAVKVFEKFTARYFLSCPCTQTTIPKRYFWGLSLACSNSRNVRQLKEHHSSIN